MASRSEDGRDDDPTGIGWGCLHRGGRQFLYRLDISHGTVLGSLRLDAHLKPSSVPLATGDALLVLLTDQAADYRSLIAVDRGLKAVRWQVAADTNWSTSRVFVWGDVVVLELRRATSSPTAGTPARALGADPSRAPFARLEEPRTSC